MEQAARNLPAQTGDVFQQIEKAKQEGANLLMPSTHIEGLSQFHAPVLETVLLSSNPEDGDVYEHDKEKEGPKKKWRPTKQALMKLSVCAGVIWSVQESRRLDNGANRDYIAYRAVGGIKKADGQPVFFSADYDIDFEVMEEEIRDSYEKKAQYQRDKTDKEKKEYVEFCTHRDMMQKRKFKLRLCEAGAMNRVLRMLLGIKQAYTTEELKKPFVMARIVFKPDYNDKEVKKAILDAHIRATFGVYGPAAAPGRSDRAETIDITPMEEEGKAPNGEGAPGDAPASVTNPKVAKEGTPLPGTEQEKPPSTTESQITDFGNLEITQQCKTITDLVNKKGYKLKEYMEKAKRETLDALTPKMRTGLFAHLLTLPDLPEDVGF